MAVLLDTNVLVRLSNAADAAFPVATLSLLKLHQRGETVHITAQNLVEFRNVATRATSLNGLGLPLPIVESAAAVFERRFPLLPETPDIFVAWKALVSAAGVVGKQVHDARLLAVCEVHQISHLLTFNVAHFARFSACAPAIKVLHPATL